MDIKSICKSLRKSSLQLANQTACEKDTALEAVCKEIALQRGKILEANQQDVKRAVQSGMSKALVERLSLDDKKIDSIISGIKNVISQTDPIGEEISGWKTPNGMSIRQVRVPMGVAAIIYESRPNVTADAFCLAYKSGNAILLRGSSSALISNKAITTAIKEGLAKSPCGIPEAIELVESTDHKDVDEILADMICDIRSRICIIPKVDDILHSEESFENKLKACIDILAEILEDDLFEIGRLNCEITNFALNYPDRIKKVLNNAKIPSNKGYLREAVYSIVKSEIDNRLSNSVNMKYSLEEIFSFIVFSYTGVETETVFNKNNALAGKFVETLFSPRKMLEIVYDNVIRMMNEEA